MQPLKAWFDTVEKHIAGNPLVIFHNLEKKHTSPSTAYLKGEILFVDGTSLAVFQHLCIIESGTSLSDYRYHYMDIDKKLIFRYDNAPHHDEIETHPHHKHTHNGIQACERPDFKDVMAEATSNVLENMV